MLRTAKTRQILWLAVLVAAAFVLRLQPVLFHPSLNWGDEIFQATEQAHRLVYGYGLQPWEFQLHMRSWLLPGAIAGIMQAARAVAPGPALYLPAIAATFGALAAAPMICAYLWARRMGAPSTAWLAALVVGTAPELVYFGDRTLAEVVAGHVMVLGLFALIPGYAVRTAFRLALGGAVLALSVALRLQILPAAALIILWAVPGPAPWRRAAAIAAGFIGLTLASGALDAATLGEAFGSIRRNIAYNVIDGASASFGVQPWYYFAIAELAIWGGLIVVPLGLCAASRRLWMLPACCAAIIIAAHMAIGHKEHRFIYPALLLLAVQAGLGLASLASRAQAWLHPRHPKAAAAAPALAGALWCLVAWLVWHGAAMQALRARVHNPLQAADYIAGAPACGIALTGFGEASWAAYGGYTHIHQHVPLYWPPLPAESAFDVWLGPDAPPPAAGFTLSRCFGTVCIWRRGGPCVSAPMALLPAPLGISPGK
jgi:phosphatidylinositol glycan class B